MLFRYASFKLINPMRRLRALSVAPIKRMNRIVISGVSLTVFFFQRGEDEFHFNRRIRNACLKLSPVYAVNLCHCFVNYRIVQPSIDRTNGFVLLMRSFASLCHKTFRMPCFNIATERPRLLYLKLKAIGQRLHGQSAVVWYGVQECERGFR